MAPPSLDQDYAYYDKSNSAGSSGAPPTATSQVARGQQPQEPAPQEDHQHQSQFVQKGLGARPMMQQQQDAQQQDDSRDGSAARDQQEDQEQQGDATEGDDALLDLEQLEELQHEAERMKALGNKHMAAQEYTRAYNAYSAALQLSPVGPSSHVFLSNRSAALLSLKRYTAAATDARRAIALAPTFGKAHARLGQSLYFLKDYEGAIVAYEDAIHYEPDNAITETYLEKARTKLQRQQEKAQRQQNNSHNRGGGEDHTVATVESSVQHTVVNSVVTDPNGTSAVVQSAGFRVQSRAMVNAVGGAMGSNGNKAGGSPMATLNEATLDEHLAEGKNGDDDELDEYQDDPDFDEALRIQERANQYLANKNYKYAIEEYTAALFLVPDDENLSPELHLGRAHALNGSRRHESAKIDSQLAIKIKPTPEAYSTLAKSLFYMKEYRGAIDAFRKCKDYLPEGESLSMFDRAYLQKAEAALEDELHDGKFDISVNRSKISSAPVPKLKPPKFVSREEALNRTPNMPAMPNNWPQQSPRDNKVIKFGEEREVTFLSEALGIKLNRGPDGIVRVIEVSPNVPGSPIAREGTIEVGDVIREAAGVDIRRPITNVMWGDTVALLKMAPRPIVLVVAKEESRNAMFNQRMQAAQNALSPTSAEQAFFPSNSSTEESVRDQMERQKQQLEQQEQQEEESEEAGQQEEVEDSPSLPLNVDQIQVASGEDVVVVDKDSVENLVHTEDVIDSEGKEMAGDKGEDKTNVTESKSKSLLDQEETETEVEEGVEASQAEEDPTPKSQTSDIGSANVDERPVLDSREEEDRMLGGEVMFERKSDPKYAGWDNLRWLSLSGERKIASCEPVYRFFQGTHRTSWFGGSGDQYLPRKIALYENPQLILVLRQAKDATEFRNLMDIPSDADVSEKDMKSNLFVESVVDPKLSKLRLSQLTNVTSIAKIDDRESDPERRRSCFTLINPFEEIVISAVRMRNGRENSYSDSGAFLELSGIEHTLSTFICRAHDPRPTNDTSSEDLSWKHQVILGTLHSYVVTGSDIDTALQGALLHERGRDSTNPSILDSRVVDAQDESGKTALHYACIARSSTAVAALVKAGSNVDIRFEPHEMTPCHMAAMHLDFKSLRSILTVNRRPNVLDALGRTPVYLAIANGRTVGGMLDPNALEQCLTIMEDYGAEVNHLDGYVHPVSLLASRWQCVELSVVLLHCNFRYPIRPSKEEDKGISAGAFFHYPIHSALITLRHKILEVSEGGSNALWEDCKRADLDLSKTLKILLGCGFEVNERIELPVSGDFPEKDALTKHVGFAPIQIVAATVMEAARQKESLGETLYAGILDLLTKLSVCLCRHGARLSLDAPPHARRGKMNNDEQDIVEPSFPIAVDRALLKLPSKELPLISVLGSKNVDDALKYWKDIKPAAVVPGKVALHTEKSPIEDSQAPGGSDEKSCAICWTPFGMIYGNRQHRCRISKRYICNDCSSKRIFDGEAEHRVSDGQFVLAKGDEIIEMNEKVQMAVAMVQVTQEKQKQQQRMEQEEAANRDSLFGGLMASVSKNLMGNSDGDSEENASTNADSIAGLNAQLSETRDKLNERGEKLSSMADKSDQLVSAAEDFASMAKELNRKSSQGFFSW
mmetsp:Transcript_36776/g.89051  ORF Transcript_36776/g.89051 Transcript_36776/m.89051 type:complete len:1626 (-) Transcript_36776:2830-7707(-)